jgi:hypothetical protein
LSKTDVEAEMLEKKAKEQIKIKNYEAAIELFGGAKSIYLELNYIGKVGIIDKQINQLKKALDYEKKSKEKQKVDFKIAEKSNIIIKKPKYDEYKERIIQDSDRSELISEAELRRIKIQEHMTQKEKKREIISQSEEKIEKRELFKNQEFQKRQEELSKIEGKEKEKQIMIKNAEDILDLAKKSVNGHKFENAKKYYKEAIDLFKNLEWFEQVDVLYKEIKNIESYEIEYLKKLKKESLLQANKDQAFQKQTDFHLEEKKKREDIITARLKKLPSDLKIIMEKAKMIHEKAEKELQSNLFQRALNRYQYILELYALIPNDQLDLSLEIEEINKKITELKTKV